MARIRTIKPEFFTSEDIVSLSPLSRLLYVALWCEADREGRLVWRPRTFKLRYLPTDNCDADALCQELIDGGLVVLYGDDLAYIPSFARHQHLNPRESASTLPEPDAKTSRKARKPIASARVVDASARVDDAQGGREGKGKEGVIQPPPPGGGVPPEPKTTKAAPIECPEGVAAQVWSDWLALRRAKKAPVTATVVEGAHSEAAKAGMSLDAFLRVWCARGSQGLQAEWLRPEERQAARPPPVRPLSPGEARMLEACPSVVSESVRQRAAVTAPKPLEFVDVVEPTPAARRLG